MSELKKCPQCGGELYLTGARCGNNYKAQLICEKCGSPLYLHTGETLTEAIDGVLDLGRTERDALPL